MARSQISRERSRGLPAPRSLGLPRPPRHTGSAIVARRAPRPAPGARTSQPRDGRRGGRGVELYSGPDLFSVLAHRLSLSSSR
jgi:hypothetical protein